MASPREQLVRFGPAAVGALALLIGVSMALRAPRQPPTDSATVNATVPASAPAAPVTPPDEGDGLPPYQPDLGGPDMGELLVPTADAAAALATVGHDLLWLTTEGARLMSLPLAGGAARPLYAARSPEAFGGALAADEAGVLWSVERVDDGPTEVWFLSAAALAAEVVPPPRRLATAVSPDNLLLHGGTAWWSDGGALFRRDVSERQAEQVLATDALVTSLAASPSALYWCELPLDDRAHGHALRAARTDGSAVVTRLQPQRERQRRLLLLNAERLWWVEGASPDWRLRRLDLASNRLHELTRTGEVTALVLTAGRLYWAEVHDTPAGPISVLRTMSADGGAPHRLGRHRAPVTALAVHRGALYFASRLGISRSALPPSAAPPNPRD